MRTRVIFVHVIEASPMDCKEARPDAQFFTVSGEAVTKSQPPVLRLLQASARSH